VTQERFRLVISVVLALGGGSSAVLIGLGLVGALLAGWQTAILGGAHDSAAATDFGNLLPRLASLQPLAISQLGLIVLLATPVLRVATSAVGFMLEGDRLYAVITLAVLAVLLASILLLH